MVKEKGEGDKGLWRGGGYEGTHFWIDPKRDFVGVIMSQMFPTNKPHISYSEIRAWAECPFRHHLMYVEKINTYKENPILFFLK